ncbi:hypothetical protein V8F20_006816 [Naviculisporaceae sp. PSN 640]
MNDTTSNSTKAILPKPTRASTTKTYYLIRLDGPLSSPETVRVAGGLPTLPETFTDESNPDDEDSDLDSNYENPQQTPTRFCRIDNITKDKTLAWLSSNPPPAAEHSDWRPLIIKDARAHKDLSSVSAYPTLGVDTTLPQHRLHSISPDQDLSLRPTQNEYPVWYFFYGTLADPDVLRRVLELPDDSLITYHSARLTTCGDRRYKALVDFTTADNGDAGLTRKNDTTSVIEGKTYLVQNREEEDNLRVYETDLYEVVRCAIELEMNGEVKLVKGLTFRFTGIADD